MHSGPQISLHEIAVLFNSSRDAKIQRLCRVNLGDDFSPVDSPSTRLCRVKVLSGFSPTGFPSTRLCRVKLPGGSAPIGSSSTRLCTDQFIREKLSDKTPPIIWIFRQSHSRIRKEDRDSAIPLSFKRSRHLKNTLIPIKAMRGRIGLQKHFVRNYLECY